MSFTPTPLTASQIKNLDEITIDGQANESMLKVALGFYSNRVNELEKSRKEFWEELAEIYGLDLQNVGYTIKMHNGAMCIVEDKEEK